MHANRLGAIRRWALGAGLALVAPAALAAQGQIVTCDFDIPDDQGRLVWGNTIHLVGRAGSGTDPRGEFILLNGNNPAADVDNDGYATGCDYNNLFIPEQQKTNLINVDNPSLAIPSQNVVIADLPRRLPSGGMARVEVFVLVPPGTAAGRYLGEFFVRDTVRGTSFNSTFETLGTDRILVEVTVLENRGLSLVDSDSAARLDSLVIRGRAGQRASGVLRIANTGNTPLSNVRLSATDLRSESAVGLIIPAANVSFSVNNFSSLIVADTQRVTVTVQIPRGMLGGRYRGTLFVQGEGAAPQQIPLIVIVTSNRGILFANNPVRSVNGDIAQIAFNGDPGTRFQLGIFDMSGLMVHETSGVVFAGVGTGPGPAAGADFAVNVTWPLINGRGEAVASGMYLVVVESFVQGRRQLAKDRLMVIR